jgi:predicted acyltransferase
METLSSFPDSYIKPAELPTSTLTGRLHSIDVFRAFTMFLMIFVNDLWTLENIPYWLGHMASGEDGLGLADVVFPAFLLIVGLSIPFAIRNRLQKGESLWHLGIHIILRSLALLVMGVYHVNLETYSSVALLPKPVWQIAITLGFFMVWLDYKPSISKIKRYSLQGIGLVILASMALLYTGGTPEEPVWMRLQWYGILGLIGWSYLICSFVYLLFRENALLHILALLFFIFFNAAGQLGLLEPLSAIKPYVWIVGEGSMPAFTMAGLVITVYYGKLLKAGKIKAYWVLLGGMAGLMLLFGMMTRPVWGIHKIGSSTSWTTICIGLSILVFAGLIWLVDLKKKKEWFHLIRPAGTSTLTCYLLPYLHYALYSLVGISLPLFLRTGVLGLFKSMIYALLIIVLTGLLEKWKLRLKI